MSQRKRQTQSGMPTSDRFGARQIANLQGHIRDIYDQCGYVCTNV